VFEEGDAELMLSEIVRVTRPGGRVGIAVRAIDMPFWVNLPLEPALKAKLDAPGIIGGGAAPKGVADMSLYRRLAALGLTGLRCFPQLVSVVPGSERVERYQQQILAALTPAEVERWRQAVTAAQADGTFFYRPSLSLRGRDQPGCSTTAGSNGRACAFGATAVECRNGRRCRRVRAAGFAAPVNAVSKNGQTRGHPG
jgi:hypothetical protein